MLCGTKRQPPDSLCRHFLWQQSSYNLHLGCYPGIVWTSLILSIFHTLSPIHYALKFLSFVSPFSSCPLIYSVFVLLLSSWFPWSSPSYLVFCWARPRYSWVFLLLQVLWQKLNLLVNVWHWPWSTARSLWTQWKCNHSWSLYHTGCWRWLNPCMTVTVVQNRSFFLSIILGWVSSFSCSLMCCWLGNIYNLITVHLKI
jgi:hypothetical protein